MSTFRSGGSRARASGPMSKGAPRSSSTPRSSPSTRTHDGRSPAARPVPLSSAKDRTMSDERFLITGALGCIGAWSCAQLVREEVPVILYDLSANMERLELIMSPEELEQLKLVQGDVTDLDQLERTVVEHDITHL